MADQPTFVYLHGFASSPQSAKARFFQERFGELGVALETPDLNQGEAGFRNLTLTRAVSQVHDLLDAKEARRAVVIGSSLGGYIAALAAAKDPRIEALVLMCPAFDLPARWTAWLGEEGIANWRKTRVIEVDHHAYGRKEALGFSLYVDSLGHPPYPETGVPTLILHGRKDTEVPFGTSEKYADRAPRVRLVELDSDHGLLDVTDRLWSETRAFLQPWLG